MNNNRLDQIIFNPDYIKSFQLIPPNRASFNQILEQIIYCSFTIYMIEIPSDHLFYLYQYNYQFQVLLFILFILIKNRVIKYLTLTLIVFNFLFFRNNLNSSIFHNRPSHILISPSDSKVIDFKTNDHHQYFRTYLSPLDRHFMIAPTDCQVIDIEDLSKESSYAEHLRVTFKDDYQNIFHLDQIVSQFGQGAHLHRMLYRKRCVTFVQPGQYLKRGQRYGLIRYGSNMEYRFPRNYQLNLQIGTHYRLGTPIGQIN